jgi:uncharacterized membrane protein YjjB (DUF3815 family)
MREYIIQLVAGAVGVCGFSLVLRMKKRRIPYTVLGGLISSALYFVLIYYTDSIFISSMVAAAAATIYAEIMARLLKAPATVFLLPAIVLLVPGGLLYYTMSSIVARDQLTAAYYGSNTIYTALGIAVGVLGVSVLEYHVNDFIKWLKARE